MPLRETVYNLRRPVNPLEPYSEQLLTRPSTGAQDRGACPVVLRCARLQSASTHGACALRSIMVGLLLSYVRRKDL